MNLMEVDSQMFQSITSYLQTIWSGPFQIIVSIVLLFQQVGRWVYTLTLAWMVHIWRCSSDDRDDPIRSFHFKETC